MWKKNKKKTSKYIYIYKKKGKHHAQEIDREAALQTSQNEESDSPFTFT